MDGLRVAVLRRFRANVFYTVTERGGDDLATMLRVLRQKREVTEEDVA